MEGRQYVYSPSYMRFGRILTNKRCKSIGVLSTSMMEYKGDIKLVIISLILGLKKLSCNVNLTWIKGENNWKKSNGIFFKLLFFIFFNGCFINECIKYFIFLLASLWLDFFIFSKKWLIWPRVNKLKKTYKSHKYKVLTNKYKQF